MSEDRDLYSGMIRLHILHHAAEELIFGAGMAEELARHGYKISPGTMYPILHGLEKRGYLRSTRKQPARASAASIGLRNLGAEPSKRPSSGCESFSGS